MATQIYLVAYPHPDIVPSYSIQPLKLVPQTSGKELLEALAAVFPEHSDDLKARETTIWKVSRSPAAQVLL
jgi:hypothetical protein